MGIESYSTTAASNNASPPNGAPEGMAPSAVNNTIRQIMADIRTWYAGAEWVNYGYTHTYASGTSITIAGLDVTTIYTVDRRIKATGSSTGTIYGIITNSSFSTDTTITISWDSGSLSNESLTISLALIKGGSSNQSIHVSGVKNAATSGANTNITNIYLNNTGLKIKDTNASHGLSIVPGSDLSADRTLTITSGDADRSLSITADVNISGALTVSGTTSISGVAAQSDMETASSTTLIVTPGRQQYHPSACKAWVIFNGTGGTPTVLASYNVTGVSKLYTGGYEVTIATDFSSANYGVATTARSTSFRQLIHMIAFGGAPAAGTIALESFNAASSALADVELFSVVMFGDQ